MLQHILDVTTVLSEQAGKLSDAPFRKMQTYRKLFLLWGAENEGVPAQPVESFRCCDSLPSYRELVAIR